MTTNSSSLSHLLAELKRRRVFRVMAVYGAIGFGVIEVAGEIFPRVGLPDWTVTLVVWLTLLGFPIAVVLAWAFETTPEGVRRTEAARPEEISEILAQPVSKRWPAGILAIAGVALLFGGWWMGRTGALPELNLSTPRAEASEHARIAVLPFEDLGGNEEDDPFLAGIHVDIHGKLARVGDLRVTSLSSVQEYQGSGKTAAEIAADLVVDYVLRGSVRRSGNQVRVNVQLTDIATREDVWLEEYDHEVSADNLFATQSEIARRVAAALEATLSPADVQLLETDLSTDNLEALNAYHRARAGFTAPRADAPPWVMMSHLEEAIELAPQFVEAWAMLAWLESLRGSALPASAERALEAVRKTEELAPGSLHAVKARAWYTFRVEEDLERGLELLREAERMAPSDLEVLLGVAWVEHELGQFEDGLGTMKRAARLDPRSSTTLALLGDMLMGQQRWSAARDVLERALAIDGDNVIAAINLVRLVVQGEGDPQAAIGLAEEMGLPALGQRAWMATLTRDWDRAARLYAEATAMRGDSLDVFSDVATRSILAERIWVEEMRGLDPTPLRDSLAALLDAGVADQGTPFAVLDQANALYSIGREAEARAAWEQAVESIPEHRVLPDERWYAARIAAQYGDPEDAFALLEDAVGRPTESAWSFVDLELDPRFDPIRDDPRFDELIERQRAYEEEQERLAEEEGPWLP